jgi:hypothetical protein
VARFHGQLRKVKVVLKVNWKTELCGNYEKDRPFGENVQIFYLSDLTSD